MVIFISGPMTGFPNSNREAFNEQERVLQEQGHVVLNPAWHPDGLEHSQYIHMCLAEIDVADAIYQLSGWEHSKGANIEFRYAVKNGKHIMQGR